MNGKDTTDSRSTSELIKLAAALDADCNSEEYLHPIRVLQHRLPTDIEYIEKVLVGDDPKICAIAATILGQNLRERKTMSERCVASLLIGIAYEPCKETLCAIAYSLGHLKDAKATEALINLKGNPSADVRLAMTHALTNLESPAATEVLIAMSADSDRDVRNWSTFGLGSIHEANTVALRQALLARVNDEDDEIRGEALVGLAERGDDLVIEPLMKELNRHPTTTLKSWSLMREAASAVVREAKKAPHGKWTTLLEKIKALQLGEDFEVDAASHACAKVNL